MAMNPAHAITEAEAPTSVQPLSSRVLPQGTRLRDYEITGLIGEGGFGIVYLALDHSLQRKVAIKEYMPAAMVSRVAGSSAIVIKSDRHLDTFKAGLKSFVNEARLLARFDHPSLVKVYRFWEENGTAYMVMPFYEGPTLKTALAELGHVPSEAELRTWLDPLLDALTVMHAAQCFHRDIAPDNILLTAKGPLLLDFGAARRVIGDMTHALTVVLKPGYAPIEQYGDVASMAQGAWTDLYALACVCYYAITGRTPMSSVERLMDDRLEPIAVEARGRYSDSFLRAIDAALSVRPSDRPQNEAQFRALLDADRPKRAPVQPSGFGHLPQATPAPAPATPVPSIASADVGAGRQGSAHPASPAPEQATQIHQRPTEPATQFHIRPPEPSTQIHARPPEPATQILVRPPEPVSERAPQPVQEAPAALVSEASPETSAAAVPMPAPAHELAPAQAPARAEFQAEALAHAPAPEQATVAASIPITVPIRGPVTTTTPNLPPVSAPVHEAFTAPATQPASPEPVPSRSFVDAPNDTSATGPLSFDIPSSFLPSEAQASESFAAEPPTSGLPVTGPAAASRRKTTTMIASTFMLVAIGAAAVWAWHQRSGETVAASSNGAASAVEAAVPSTPPPASAILPTTASMPVPTSTPAPASAPAPAPAPVPVPVPSSPSPSASSAAPVSPSTPTSRPRREPAPTRPRATADPGADTPAPVHRPAGGSRCSDILQKASLEPLTDAEAAYLKRECR